LADELAVERVKRGVRLARVQARRRARRWAWRVRVVLWGLVVGAIVFAIVWWDRRDAAEDLARSVGFWR
jgi:hypothetical protein